MKKKVYLVQPGYLYGNENKSAYLPYAAGVIAAYAFSQPEINERYAFSGFICFFDPIEESLEALSDADVVGFSNYVWNYKYNCELARRLKQKNPDCVIVFGGHQIALRSTSLEALPFVDYLIFGEGEAAFAALLRSLVDPAVPFEAGGVSFRKAGQIVTKEGCSFLQTEYPSPYLNGFFDPLLKKYPGVSFIALFETNRGCPFQCAYCDWGTTKDRVRFFSMERIAAEIDWFAAYHIENCFAADANFGLYPRDELISQMLIESKRKTGYPRRFDVTYAKSESERVLKIVSSLVYEKMSNGPAISFQSLNPATLKAIGRENMPLERFVEIMNRYERNGLHPYSEIILGLPEETFNSFVKGIGTLLSLGQHSYIDIFRCEILSNSALAEDRIRKKYGIKTVLVPSSLHHVSEEDDCGRYGESEIVVSTSAMPFNDMLKANMFSMIVQACHHMGLTKYVALYLYQEHGIPYETFYVKLTEYLSSLDENAAEMKSVYEAYLRGERGISVRDPRFGGISWFPEEMFFLKSAAALGDFYRSLLCFTASFLPNKNLAEQLVRYQSLFAVVPQAEEKQAFFDYDFYRFFSVPGTRLHRKKTRIRIVPPFYRDWPECAVETVWYGRRRSKTDAFLSAESITIE